MKKYILLITITLAMLTSSAQETPKHKWNIAGQISSPEEFITQFTDVTPITSANEKNNSAFSVGLFGNYCFRNNLFVRLRASICNKIVTYHDDNLLAIDTVFHYTYVRDETIRQNSKTIGFSIGKNIVEQKFIRAYVGLEMATILFDKYTLDWTNNEKNLSSIYSFVETRNYTVPGGYSLRLGPFIGCQLFFVKKLSIGPEIAYAFQYYKVGGDAILHAVAVNSSASTYFSDFDTTVHILDTSEGMGFSHIKVAFNIVYSF